MPDRTARLIEAIERVTDAVENADRRAIDAVVGAGLIAAVYATPARLRPALGLATAIGLSRAHRNAMHRYADEINAGVTRFTRQFSEQRTAVGTRVDRLEQILRSQYGGKTLDEIEELETAVAKRDGEYREIDR